MTFVGKWFGFGQNEHFDRGLRAYENKRFAEAAAHFSQAVETEPNDRLREKAISYLAGSLARMGTAALAEGQYEDAVAVLMQAAGLRPRFADVQASLATAYARVEQYDKALQHVDASLEINPRYALAHIRRAGILMKLGDVENGWNQAQSAMERFSSMQSPEWEAIVAQAKAENWDEVAQWLLSFRPAGNFDIPSLVEEFRNAMLAQDPERAEKCMRDAIKLAPSFPDLHVRLGEALFEGNKSEAALAAFEEAARLNPGYADSYALIGITLRRLGREAEAQSAFRHALTLDPNNMIASQEMDGEPI
ncbi:MAG: hypothetical protein Fur0036_01800 [Fimbriimonadaceae bacterium]